ncbi:MAG: glycosyltransferase family 2 protein [Roseiflexaceae bacterium]
MDRTNSRVSLVMITHNRRAEVLHSLAKLIRLPEQPRIVLVDNGSTDGTSRAVALTFPQVDILAVGANRGAAARTLGVLHVDTPYVALCDDDTWWEPGALAHAADLFDATPRLAIVTARVLIGPEEREDPTCRLMAHSPLPRAPGMPGAPLLGFLAGASVVRRSAFLAAGGFTPRFFLGGEEQLLAADLAASGWWLCYVPVLVVHHYPSQQRDATSRRWHLVRNTLWFAWMRRPLSGALRHTFAVIRSAPIDRAVLKGLAGALLGLPWALRQRRVLPPEIEYRLRLLESHH